MPRKTLLFSCLALLTALLPLSPRTALGDTQSLTFTGAVDANGDRFDIQTFQVDASATISATLSWKGGADLNMFLKDPSRTGVARATTSDMPETIVYEAKAAGEYRISVKAQSGKAAYSISIDIQTDTASADETSSSVTDDSNWSGSVDSNGVRFDFFGFGVDAPAAITATLSWGGGADLNMFLKGPSGSGVARATTSANPEVIVYEASQSGEFTISVKAQSGSASYTLTVDVDPISDSSASPPSDSNVLMIWSPELFSGDHDYTQAEAVKAAERFDVHAALRNSYKKHVDAMKSANPDLRLLVYMNGTFAREGEGPYPADWYARDSGGNKITSNNFGNTLMDIGHSGWINNRIDTCRDFLEESGYDGCYLDMLGTAPLEGGYLTNFPINPGTNKVWTQSQWLRATANIGAKVKSGVSPALVFGNGLGNGHRYFNSSAPTKQLLNGMDGGAAEAWIRAVGWPIDKYRTVSDWQKDVDMIIDAESRGKTPLLITKAWVSASDAEKRERHKFALTSFLLGSNGDSFFSFFADKTTSPTEWSSWWNTDLGAPTSTYYKTDGVFRRDFANGTVIVNPTGNEITIDLGATYKDLSGTKRTSITLKPATGAILTKP